MIAVGATCKNTINRRFYYIRSSVLY